MMANEIVKEVGRNIILSPGMTTEQGFVQHGVTTTYEHSISVATIAVMLAVETGLTDDITISDLVKAGLLHDYFLYDWHDNEHWHRLHGFTHGRTAYNNAIRDFGDEITPVMKDSIVKHMFPLTSSHPKYKEGWLVTISDKIAASRETFTAKRFNRTEKNKLQNRLKLISMLPCVPSSAKPALEAAADGMMNDYILSDAIENKNADNESNTADNKMIDNIRFTDNNKTVLIYDDMHAVKNNENMSIDNDDIDGHHVRLGLYKGLAYARDLKSSFKEAASR